MSTYLRTFFLIPLTHNISAHPLSIIFYLLLLIHLIHPFLPTPTGIPCYGCNQHVISCCIAPHSNPPWSASFSLKPSPTAGSWSTWVGSCSPRPLARRQRRIIPLPLVSPQGRLCSWHIVLGSRLLCTWLCGGRALWWGRRSRPFMWGIRRWCQLAREKEVYVVCVMYLYSIDAKQSIRQLIE